GQPSNAPHGQAPSTATRTAARSRASWGALPPASQPSVARGLQPRVPATQSAVTFTGIFDAASAESVGSPLRWPAPPPRITSPSTMAGAEASVNETPTL